MSAAQASPREEQLLHNIRGALEAKNYADCSLMVKGSVTSTHSLRELFIASSVDTDTSISALCTIDSEPSEMIESFEQLLSFTREEDGGVYRSEIAQVVFPVFVHMYFHLVSSGQADVAQNFYNKNFSALPHTHPAEMKEVSEIVTPDQLAASTLAKKFQTQKFCLRMSNNAFQLFTHFLQACHTPVLLNLIQRHLNIEVYGNTPLLNGGDSKSEKKMPHRPTFTKPKIPLFQAEIKPQKKKGGWVSAAGFSMAPAEVLSDSGWKHKQSQPSLATPNPTSTAHLLDFKERLAQHSHLDPSPPSVALFTVQGGPLGVHCAAFSSAIRHFCCGMSDSSVHLWAQTPGATTDHVTSHITGVQDHAPSLHQPIRLQGNYGTVPSSCEHRVLLGHHGPVYGTCFSSNGHHLLSASEDCCVRLWDVQKQRSLVAYRGHAYPIWDVSFCSVDVYFASASYDRTARLWSPDVAHPLRVLAGHTAGVSVVRFHPNGKYVATGSSDHTCRLWDIQSGQCVRLMAGSKGAVGCIAFSPNGKHMVSGGDDGVIRLWDLGSASVVKELCGETDSITSLAYSPDGTLLASSHYDNQIQMWNMRATVSVPPNSPGPSSQGGELILQHSTSDALVLSLHFTHRNCLIAIATSDTQKQTN